MAIDRWQTRSRWGRMSQSAAYPGNPSSRPGQRGGTGTFREGAAIRPDNSLSAQEGGGRVSRQSTEAVCVSLRPYLRFCERETSEKLAQLRDALLRPAFTTHSATE